MGQAVVHFEVVGKDGEKLKGFYSGLFGWEIDSDNPMSYGLVTREGNTNADGIGIGGGISAGQEGQSYVGASRRNAGAAGATKRQMGAPGAH